MTNGYVDTTNAIELVRVDILHEMKVIEECTREKHINAANDLVVETTNDCIEKARKRRDFQNLQLPRAMERSPRYDKSVQNARALLEQTIEERRAKCRNSNDDNDNSNE